MTAMITHTFLQNYWWCVISLLASLLVFLLFVQGGQSFIFSLGKTEVQKSMIINTMGRKWEFTFTTLVTFGGAFFASFPLFYATSFGGAYWVWIAILFSFIIQAVSYEYRSKPSNILGQKTFDIFLFINGCVGPFLIGTAVATFFTGSRFSLNELNQVKWATSLNGLEALFNIRNLALGFSVLFLARILGLLYIINSIDDKDLIIRSRKRLIFNTLIFLIFFLFFIIRLMLADGYAINEKTGSVYLTNFKYLHNYLQMPIAAVLFVAGILGVLLGIGSSIFTEKFNGIWYAGAGTILTVFSLFLVAGFNNTSFYPSSFDLQSSLTIANASSSLFTLRTMFFISFIIPFVMAYIWYAWRSMNKSKMTGEEMEAEGEHVY
jgi:cytochrome bd ubiquinol oxidase subunit II